MPKYDSKLVKKEEIGPDGKVKLGGTLWEPMNDAAMVSKMTQENIAAGLYVPKDPDAVKKAQARIDEFERKEDIRKGRV